jgi:DNA-binding transcriptional ArsR family regulator
MTTVGDTREGRADAALPGPRQAGAREHPLPDDLVELIAVRFRVLGEPMRIKLLDRMRTGEATVQALVAATGASQQNVSKHLGVLLREGIVGRRKEGNFVHYSIVDPGVFSLCEDVCGDLQRRLDALREIVGPPRA